ncbi:MAG: VWA domain-containing protein [Proteobacteria bacterium]|nr:VWA domain-containing protein [Pseudomonadota bacterium]
MFFARLLRAAGLPVGPGKVLDAVQAVSEVGIANRTDFYWALHAVFVNRRDQRELFDQAFHVFWRNPRLLERMMSLVLPSEIANDETAGEELAPRIAEALATPAQNAEANGAEEPEQQFDAVMTWSRDEVLSALDFEKMTGEEMEAARAMMRRLTLPIIEFPTRRFRPNIRGARTDIRAMLRNSLKYGGDFIPLKKKSRQRRPPPLVVLCDISGSMERYSRMLLHFLHALTNDRDRVHTFLFGTRLTNVTRCLRQRDVDIALQAVTDSIDDWSGGTRIGHCISTFNRDWSRRVLGQNAVVLLISDGLDRDAGSGLETEIDRLHKSCRKLIWLNPLLRYEAFEPKSQGIRAILPYVDDFRTVHNLNSLSQLADVLSQDGPRTSTRMAQWRERAA